MNTANRTTTTDTMKELMRNATIRHAHQDHASLCQAIPGASPEEASKLRAEADRMWEKIREMTKCRQV